MLQINTGKLYSNGVGRVNTLTGVLHTNARLPWDSRIETAAGSLRGAGFDRGDRYCVFEMEERIEKAAEGPGVLVSHGVGPFLDDMAVVATIGLGALFARGHASIATLSGETAGFSSYRAPKQFIGRVFEEDVYARDEDVAAFQSFVADLLALDRRTYLGAMRAMRGLVAGLHRIQDDLGLAYTLMVSAIESLAQDFDGHQAVWSDVDERKRRAIDSVLKTVDGASAEALRAAILEHEHVALARRYRAFVLNHIDPTYFRQAVVGGRPIASFEVEPALKKAYALRSAFIHQARGLPDEISHPHDHWEVTSVERQPALTFQGLFRLSRHVLLRFVAEGRKVEAEPYDYRREEAGVVMMEMAPQYWIARELTDADQALKRLEGQISLTAAVLLKEPGASLVDIRSALADAERLLPQASAKHKVALLNLHFLFNLMIHPHLRTPDFDAFLEKHGDEANEPGPISLIASTILGATADWPVEAHTQAIDDYFQQRVRSNGLHAPRVFEAAALLDLAEKHRLASDNRELRAALARAVEIHPGQTALREFELAYDGIAVVVWRDILLPQDEDAAETHQETEGGGSAPATTT